MCGYSWFSVHQIFFELLQSFRKICQHIVRIFLVILLLILILVLHSNTEREDELEADRFSVLGAISISLRNECWDGDVEDETLSEMENIPGTDKLYKVVRLVDSNLPFFTQSWLSTADPLKRVFVVFGKLVRRLDSRHFSNSYTITNRFRSWTNTCVSSRVCTSPLIVNILVDVLDLFTVSICSDYVPFCSACVSMFGSRARIIVLLTLSKSLSILSMLRQEIRT